VGYITRTGGAGGPDREKIAISRVAPPGASPGSRADRLDAPGSGGSWMGPHDGYAGFSDPTAVFAAIFRRIRSVSAIAPTQVRIPKM